MFTKSLLIFLASFLLFLTCPIIILAEQIDINTAILSQLDELTGIGPVYAQRIIDSRPYASLDDLLKVQGIGSVTLQKIKDQGFACVDCQTLQAENDNPNNQIATSTPITTDPDNQFSKSSEVGPQRIDGDNNDNKYPEGIWVSEVLPSPQGSDTDNEWLEIFNNNNFEVDLTGWQIRDKIGTIKTYTFPAGTIIKAKGFFVLSRKQSKITLQNTEDGLEILNPLGTIVDSMDYPKAITNQSYNKTTNGWAWSTTLTPNNYNVITTPEVANKAANSATASSTQFISKEDKILADISKTTQIPKNNWLVLIIGIAIAILATTITLIIRTRNHTKEQYFT